MANRDFSKPFSGLDAELLFPGALSRGAKDARGKKSVKRVQEWLTHHNQAVSIDGEFGPATEAALRAFQARELLPATGTVDEATWAALVAPLRRATAPLALPPEATYGEVAAAYARQFVAEGPREIGGDNCGPWVRVTMLGNDGSIWQWCAGTAAFFLALATRHTGKPIPFRMSFGVPDLVRYAKPLGRFYEKGPAQVGDLFVVPKGNSFSHVGIVLAWNGETITTAEGNTNGAGSANGNVARTATRASAKMRYLRVS
ncbi:MAG: peptidoglycan-binding protein [Myxococcales bacterium]|nr:peptidoglycan-binding protein [Myxococcales bacterium]